jgi:transcriptional regulator with XRE-family HTH domain
MLRPEQSKCARAWLGWSQTDLAKRAGVALSTVNDFETGRRLLRDISVAQIHAAFERAGILIDDVLGISDAPAVLDAFSKMQNPGTHDIARAVIAAAAVARSGGRQLDLSEVGAAILAAGHRRRGA